MAPDDERKRRESAQFRTSNNSPEGPLASSPRSTSRLPAGASQYGGDASMQSPPTWNRQHRTLDSMVSRTDSNYRGTPLSPSAVAASSLTSSSSAVGPSPRPPPSTNFPRTNISVPSDRWSQQTNNILPTTAMNSPSASGLPTSRVVGVIGGPHLGAPRLAERDDKFRSTGNLISDEDRNLSDSTPEEDRHPRQVELDLSGKIKFAHSSPSYIGVGLISLVWIGQWNRHTNKPAKERLALKTFHGSCLFPSTFESNLRYEARSWVSFNHKNILRFLGICNQSLGGPMVDAPVLVAPYCPEGNIRNYLKKYPKTTSGDRLELVHEIADGLLYLHDMQCVHGDLKGRNIMIDEEGAVRITDYGLTRLLGPIKHSRTIRSTPRWAAPELISAEEGPLPLTTASDVWAFGMVVLEVMTSNDPWHTISETTVILRVLRGCIPEKQDYPVVGRDIWDVLKKCWELDPRHRPNISKVQRELPHPLTKAYSTRR